MAFKLLSVFVTFHMYLAHEIDCASDACTQIERHEQDESEALRVELLQTQVQRDRVLEKVDPVEVGGSNNFYTAQMKFSPPASQDDMMNYGMYTDPLHPCAEAHNKSHMANMYAVLANNTDFAGKHVLEVGSGRGGGAGVLSECYCPAHYVGMDLEPEQVASSNARLAKFGSCNLMFTQGDAVAIPFPDNTFDVVINVESSHMYPNRSQFFTEVRRVLTPKGKFLYEDMLWTHRYFHETHLELKQKFGNDIAVRNITQNVVDSIEMRKEQLKKRVDECMEFSSKLGCEDYWINGGLEQQFMFEIQLH